MKVAIQIKRRLMDKYQDKNKFIFHNELSNTRCNQIKDIIKESYILIMVHLENDTWINYKHLPLLKEIRISLQLFKREE